METETINRKPGRKFYIITSTVLIALLLYYSVMSMISPGRKYAEMKKEFSPSPDNKEQPAGEILHDSTYLSLLKEKAFLQARTQMAQTDSIYMALNLCDSTASIEINGVTVHQAKISKYRMSSIFSKGDQNIIYSILSSPFTISGSAATIKKEPVMLKVAPRDTSEFKADNVPDTSAVETVNYVFEMTNGTRIYVYQEEKEDSRDRRISYMFDLKQRLGTVWNTLKSIAVFRVPEYHPFIKIRIPRDDSKIIYRALPVNGQIAIYT